MSRQREFLSHLLVFLAVSSVHLAPGQPSFAACTGTKLTVGGFPPSYPLLDPNQKVHNGQSRKANYDQFVLDLYDQSANPNITKVLFLQSANRQLPPWFDLRRPAPPDPDCTDAIADAWLHKGDGLIPAPTLNPPNYLVNGDETSELALVTALSPMAVEMWNLYRTYEIMKSPTYTGLPCWLARVNGSTFTCIKNGAGHADTATDATVRWGLAFYLAATNSDFPASDRAIYLQTANTIASAHLLYEYTHLSEPCPVSPLTAKSLCHFVAAGAETAQGNAEMLVGYYQDVARFLLAAYSATNDLVYLNRAEEVVDQFLVASGYSGQGQAFGCKTFRWTFNGTSAQPIPLGCPFGCEESPGFVWDDADAPRALWMPDVLRAYYLVSGGAPLPPAYQALLQWGSAVAAAQSSHTATCSCLQYSANGSSNCNCGPGHWELGLGIGLQLYLAPSSVAEKLDAAIGRYNWGQKHWDYPPNCFWIYRGVRTVKALAAAIGLDEKLFRSPEGIIFRNGFESGSTSAWKTP